MRFPFLKFITRAYSPHHVSSRNGGGGGTASDPPMAHLSPYAAAGASPEAEAAAGASPEAEEDVDDEKERMDKLAKDMCLPVDQFLPLLQGEGVLDKKSTERLLKYPDVRKLAIKCIKLGLCHTIFLAKNGRGSLVTYFSPRGE